MNPLLMQPGAQYPMYPGEQQMNPVQQAMMSPAWARLGQAAQNLTSMKLDRQPTQTPMQAYQQNILQRVKMDQDQRLAEQKLNPFYDYEEAQRRGYLTKPDGTEMGLAEFMQLGLRPNYGSANIQDINQLAFLRQQASNPDLTQAERDEYKFLADTLQEGIARTQQIKGPGNAPGLVGPGGNLRLLYGSGDMAEGAGQVAGAQEAAKGRAQTAVEQTDKAIEEVWANNQAWDVAARVADISDEYKGMLERGEIETGLIDNFLLDFLGYGTQELAAMDAEGVQQVLENLKITNLAPVTEQELRTVAKLWADAFKQEEPNIGVLKRAIRESEALQKRIERRTRTQGNRLKEYGGEEEFQRLQDSNPWFKGLYMDFNLE